MIGREKEQSAIINLSAFSDLQKNIVVNSIL
jgi:hypothetical protein